MEPKATKHINNNNTYTHPNNKKHGQGQCCPTNCRKAGKSLIFNSK